MASVMTSFLSLVKYIDAKAGPKIKSAAQGLITLATYGLGMLVGFWSAGKIYDMYALDDGLQWSQVWIAPAGFAFVVLLIFLFTFKNEKLMSMAKIRMGILGGSGDSFIGPVHRIASSMFDRFEIVGGVFNRQVGRQYQICQKNWPKGRSHLQRL